MTIRNRRLVLFMSLALVVTTLPGVSAAAAQSLPADSTRLDQLRRDLQTELRRVDAQPAAQSARLRDELEDLRDEVGYLRVVQRRGQKIQDREYRQLELRLQGVRQEIRNAEIDRTSGSPQAARGSYEVPVGTELDVRLRNELSSDTAMVEDRFEATTVVDLYEHERLLVPAGSLLRGVVSGVDRASRIDRRGSLTVTFDEMTVQGRTYDIRANVVEALEGGIKGEVGKIGAGAGVGAIIGGILGGTKGALAGILIGAGGTVLATEGNDVDLPVGTIIRVRFESPVWIASRGR